ncbi:Sex-determining fem-1 [Fusarium globosum]|uniref:Sex-determining fem-1 n=1 Tax=Fusarium globosum TaxID=78864 RepID=A0A8H5YT92_9HYPO|nr:Sex-determining fem-1 [Fusarium globosum]
MPEWYPEEHVRAAQTLLTSPASDSSAECFKVMVYMMSNSKATDRQVSFFANLIGTGKMELRDHFRKLQKESPTIQSFLEKIFQFEIEKATRAGCLELIQLLLRFQARVDRQQVSDKRDAFINLALGAPCSDSRKLRILAVLSDYRFISKDEVLRAAIELHDEEAILRVLDCGIDITSHESSWLHAEARDTHCSTGSYIASQSALMMAVHAGDRIANLMLDHLLLKGQLSSSALADAYIAAAFVGNHVILLRLEDTILVSEMIYNTEGITPLQAAVVGGNLAVCQHILERHGGASASLILAAAILGSVEIIELLIEYGGDPDSLILTDDIQMYDYFNVRQLCRDGQTVSKLSIHYQLLKHQDGHQTPVLAILMRLLPIYDIEEPSVLKLIQNGATRPHDEMITFSRLCFHACLKAALEAGGNPNDESREGDTVLQCALSSEFIKDEYGYVSKLEDRAFERLLTVKLLMQAGARLTGGEVVRAIYLREWSLVSFLLQNGGTLTDVDNTGRGCLEAEIEAQNDRTLQDVLEAQELPIDAGPFCASLQMGDWTLVRRLFERAHKPTSCHLVEGTAVGLAARAGQLDILDKLLARFTDPSVLSLARLPVYISGDLDCITETDYREVTCFWRSATDDSYFIVGSPLALAALGEDTCGFGELLRRGCKMDTVTWAIIAESPVTSDYLQLLKEFGCELGNATEYDEELRTKLCKAITEEKSDLAQYLVEVGADVNEYDIFARGCISPLQCAVQTGLMEVAIYLLGKKANINAPPAFEQGATALQFAAIGGHIGLARQLIELGARINARGSGKGGRSALEGAAEHGRLDMLALLVHHGAVTTGPGRQQLINSVAFAQQRAHITAADWLKKNSGWCDQDQRQLEFVDAHADCPVGDCIRAYCCDEYHDTDTQCVYHYTEEQRQIHYDDCERCEKIRNDRDDGSESNLSSEDEEMDSGWVDHDQETAQSLDVMEQYSGSLWLLLGLLALSTGSGANGPCETSLGSSTVDVIRTSTTTRNQTITITDKIIIQTVPLNITKSKTRPTWLPVTDKTISTVGITTTTTIRATFTKLVTVTANPEAKIATITVTKPSFVNRTETMTKTKTKRNTITTTTYFATTIGIRPGFTAIRDNMERISSEFDEKTTTVGLDAKLFSHTLSVICTDDLPIKKTVTTTSFRAQSQTLPKTSTSTSTMTVWTTINETQYPAGLCSTVTTTVHPIQTALINATKTITLDETITLERRIPQETHYQVCDNGSSNYLSWAPGDNPSDKRMIKEFSRQNHEVNPTEIKVSDAIACCNECMKRKYCRISFWGRPPGAKREVPHSCYIYLTINIRQCMDGAQPLYARYLADRQVLDPITAPWFTFSNGPCGQLKFGGVKDDKWHKPMKHDGFDIWNSMDDEGTP